MKIEIFARSTWKRSRNRECNSPHRNVWKVTGKNAHSFATALLNDARESRFLVRTQQNTHGAFI